MDHRHPLEWKAVEKVTGAKAVVDGVGVDVVYVEEQGTRRGGDRRGHPLGLAERARRRFEQRRDVLHVRRRADGLASPRDVACGALDGGRCSRRRGQVADSDAASTHEGEVLTPRFRADVIDERRDGIESALVDSRRGSETQSNAVEHDGHLCRERPQRRPPARRCAEIVIGNDLEHIDPPKMREDARGQLGTPAQTHAIVLFGHRHMTLDAG